MFRLWLCPGSSSVKPVDECRAEPHQENALRVPEPMGSHCWKPKSEAELRLKEKCNYSKPDMYYDYKGVKPRLTQSPFTAIAQRGKQVDTE